MKSKIFLLCCLALSSSAFTACNDDDDNKYLDIVTESSKVTNVVWTPDSTNTSGVVTASYCLDKNKQPAGFGVCYTTDGSLPTVNQYCIKTSDYNLEKRTFSVELTDVKPNVTYNLRAFVALFEGGINYSDVVVIFPKQELE